MLQGQNPLKRSEMCLSQPIFVLINLNKKIQARSPQNLIESLNHVTQR